MLTSLYVINFSPKQLADMSGAALGNRAVSDSEKL